MAAQWWDHFATNPKSKKPKATNKLIEALRQPQHSSAQEAQEIGKKQESFERKYQRLNLIRRTEKEIYNRHKRKVEEEIRLLQEQIRQELDAIKRSAKKIDKQLEIAAEQNIVNPGTYDVNFLQKLITWIRLFRAKIEDAAIWLTAWNQKNKKRGAFWSMFASKKGGAKFLLSSEHYMVRSAG